jgi:IS30 family transposase
MEGAGKTAYIAAFVDKPAKLLRGKVMPDKAADNGSDCKSAEFTGHKGLAQSLGCEIYFAHPCHSRERGLNEDTNGLGRQYLPKGTSFEGLTPG